MGGISAAKRSLMCVETLCGRWLDASKMSLMFEQRVAKLFKTYPSPRLTRERPASANSTERRSLAKSR